MKPSPPSACHRAAFTLIELLVVVAIIAILAGMLLPALSRAKAKALQIKCVSNSKQVILAYHLYTHDNRDSYPLCRDWASAGGTNGRYDVFVAMTNKPLYPYQGSPSIFACPADKGDIFRERVFGDFKATNCFRQYGTSYLMEWAADFARVKRVTGDINAPGTYQGTSIKSSEVALAPSTKIVQGDWPWHPNRGWDDPKSRWHNVKGKSLSIVTFGDGHAAAFKFPTLRDSDPFWTRPPDPAAEWW